MIEIEIAIDDAEGALIAEQSGAQRVEVCSDLSVGGLTPSIGMVKEILQTTQSIDLVIMIRPRAGNFHYSQSELATMAADIKAFNEMDFGGRKVSFIYGVLKSDNSIDVAAIKELMESNKSGRNSFHMAFDSTPDLTESLVTLIELGFTRILTSGGAKSAYAGREKLRELHLKASGKIEIVAGGSIRSYNALKVVKATGLSQIHLRAPEARNEAGRGKYDSAPIISTSARKIKELIHALESGEEESALLVVDVGGTSLKGALISPEFEILARKNSATKEETSQGDLEKLIVELLDEAKKLKVRIFAIGVIVPGSIDEVRGVVNFASNMGWKDYPLAQKMREKFNIPVAIGHDVRTAALADGALGSAEGFSHYISVSIGTGIAAAAVNGGKVISGATNTAGEAGHMPLDLDGPQCPCGQRGCWERYASGDGISERYFELTGKNKTAQEVVTSIPTDSDALLIWNQALSKTAQALAILVFNLDPSVIVIGGGVAAGYAHHLPALQEQLQELLAWRVAPEIRISSLSGDAGIYGAAILALQKSQ